MKYYLYNTVSKNKVLDFKDRKDMFNFLALYNNEKDGWDYRSCKFKNDFKYNMFVAEIIGMNLTSYSEPWPFYAQQDYIYKSYINRLFFPKFYNKYWTYRYLKNYVQYTHFIVIVDEKGGIFNPWMYKDEILNTEYFFEEKRKKAKHNSVYRKDPVPYCGKRSWDTTRHSKIYHIIKSDSDPELQEFVRMKYKNQDFANKKFKHFYKGWKENTKYRKQWEKGAAKKQPLFYSSSYS